MNKLILTPTDVLMLKDARPMEGSLPGHTLSWPTPDIISHALRGALHRSGLRSHSHHLHPQGQARNYESARVCKFGSVVQAGPFPVRTDGDAEQWFFPCPLDVEQNTCAPTCGPVRTGDGAVCHSLPAPLKYGVASTAMPSKENRAPAWISADAWQRYQAGSAGGFSSKEAAPGQAASQTADSCDITEIEHTFGIARNDDTACVHKGSFYSASYLRLLPGWSMGSLVASAEKDNADGRVDVVADLIPREKRLVVGGQQRTCTATLTALQAGRLPLPKADVAACRACLRVKWVLLTPAIWSRHGSHPGGWLPTWVDAATGKVELCTGDRTRRPGECRESWRARIRQESSPIAARLVAAVTGKPVPITGYAGGKAKHQACSAPKSTHLAVPAGSVYYFECDTPEAAAQLVQALDAAATANLNRRSELLGEQGFGLGVCAPWHFADEQ